MKKIISLFIIFLFVFCLFPYSFAMETKSIDINGFDEFSLEQVQKTFSNSLTRENKSDTQSKQETDNLLFNNIDYNIPSTLFVNSMQQVTNIFCYDSCSYGLNFLYHYKLFENINSDIGISEYKIKQNTYMAVAVFDMFSFVYI